MTRSLPRECAVPGCTAITDTGRCAEHPRRPWQRTIDHHTLLTATGVTYRQWRRARGAALHRDHNRCVACGQPATEVDHVIRLTDGGSPISLRNLQSLCSPCHTAKTIAERKVPSR